MNKKEELEDIFKDVRKAYRLLYHYQRRVLDLIQGLSKALHYSYQGGCPHYMKPSPNTLNGNLDQSAWDWLNMYFYEFRMKPKIVGKKTLYLSVFIQSDSGPFASGSPLEDLSSFSRVEESKTRLNFLFYDKELNDVVGDFLADGDIPAMNNSFKTNEHNGGVIYNKSL